MPSYIVQITSDSNRKPQFVASIPDATKGCCDLVTDVQDALLFDSAQEAHSAVAPIVYTRTTQGYLTGWFRNVVGLKGRTPKQFNIKLAIIDTFGANISETVDVTVIRGVGIRTSFLQGDQHAKLCG